MMNWALVVGINAYPAPAGQTLLKGAVADAADFADWALHPRGGNVANGQLFFWSHPAPSTLAARLKGWLAAPTPWVQGMVPDLARPPTATEISLTAFGAAKARANTPGPHRIYVFLAGHGLQTTSQDTQFDPQLCFVAGDFMPPEEGVTIGLVPCDDLRRGLLAQGFDQVFMFLDCCRTAVATNVTAPALGWQKKTLPAKLTYSVGRAAQSDQLALEAPKDNPTRGAFSQVLLDGLRRRRDSRGDLTTESLAQYVYTTMPSVLENREQTPHFTAEPPHPPLLLLNGQPIEPNVDLVINFRIFGPDLQVILRDHEATVVDTIPAIQEVVTLQLPAGHLYSLETADQKKVVPFEHSGPGVTRVVF